MRPAQIVLIFKILVYLFFLLMEMHIISKTHPIDKGFQFEDVATVGLITLESALC